MEDKEEEYSTKEIILNLKIGGFRNVKEKLIRILSHVTQIREPAVILITRTLRHKMLKAKKEGYRSPQQIKKARKRIDVISFKKLQSQQKARKIKNQKWNQ